MAQNYSFSRISARKSGKKFENTCRDVTFQHFELKILASHNAILPEDSLHRLAGQFWVVILLAEVTEPHVLQMFAHILCDGLSTVGIAQMAVVTQYTFFQVLRIRSLS